MSHPHDDPETELARMIDAARGAEPPALDAARARAMIAQASSAAASGPRRRTNVLPFALAAAAAVVLLVGTLARREAEVAQVPVESRLVAGDRVVRTAEARFSVDERSGHRDVQVTRGTVLFDVVPLAPGESFSVSTSEVRVEVRGTVFSVEREHGRSIVRVYEGHVHVTHARGELALVSGQMWSSDGGGGARALDIGPLDAEGRAAADARALDVAPSDTSPPASPLAADHPTSVASHDALAVPTIPTTRPASEEAVAESTPSSRGSSNRTSEREARAARGSPSLADASRFLSDGDYARALEASRAAPGSDPQWMMVRADALRGLRRPAEAADAYDAAARDPGLRAEAGYLAASLRFRTLRDPEGALRSLDRAGVDASVLGERSLGLRVRILVALGRTEEARGHARAYLARHPSGGLASYMREVTGEASP